MEKVDRLKNEEKRLKGHDRNWLNNYDKVN